MTRFFGVEKRQFLVLIFASMMVACVSVPEGITPVTGVDFQRYQGKWFEIARLDNSFEQGMEQVTAEYSSREDGGIRVINRGYSIYENEWKEAEGRAYTVNAPDEGFLKVSFFGPFYGAYIIFGLDKVEYQYTFVAGNNHKYLWLLARTPEVSEELKSQFVTEAEAQGFNTEDLIWVNQVSDN
ncbi:lipocalin family protein [Corallincola platygyrae]|uniref:Outer membrane lipoprotein Blc n=1 Tax=Corallincola platygyrae TaxID=1193278 RepID=A0ABW4XLB6_9GAMM